MSDVALTWEEVALTYGRKIYNFAHRLTSNQADASDLANAPLGRGDRRTGRHAMWHTQNE